MTKEAAAAVVTIKQPEHMTKKGRRAIAEWLRQTARYLETNKLCGPTFRGRYMYQ